MKSTKSNQAEKISKAVRWIMTSAFLLTGLQPAILDSAGVTIITHGFQLTSKLPVWPTLMADAITERTPEGQTIRYLLTILKKTEEIWEYEMLSTEVDEEPVPSQDWYGTNRGIQP